MTYVLRAAGPGDLAALYGMARSTGGGFTNLPPDEAKLAAKLATSAEAFARGDGVLGDDRFMFILDDLGTGAVAGTCQVFSQIGMTWPFYSYRIDSFATYSRELHRSIDTRMLSLSTDLSGSCEVGGLFLHPDHRASGVGPLLARSRYLFIGAHRSRFAGRCVAELRGVVDAEGNAAFWDGLAGRFFGIPFREADEFNAVHGNQFIADLMPRNPIYTVMLPESALAVMGEPHPSGRAAMRMLEKEGFAFRNYVDIFDGGPTMTVATDDIATIREAREDSVTEVRELGEEGIAAIVSHGRFGQFRASYGRVAPQRDGLVLDRETAAAIHAGPGGRITYVAR